jgi:hypothetical protein
MPDRCRRGGRGQGRRFAAAIAAASVVGLAACGDDAPVVGSGDSETQPRNVGEFTKVESSGAVDLRIEIGSPSEFTVTADDNVIDLVTTEVDDGTLRIDLPGKLTAKTPVSIEATIGSLEELRADGSGSIDIEDLDGGDLRFEVDGTARLSADGRADALVLELSGSVSADLEDLEVERAEVTLEGAGDVVVNARDELKVDLQGTGTVTYLGEPSIESKIDGAGTVTKASPR